MHLGMEQTQAVKKKWGISEPKARLYRDRVIKLSKSLGSVGCNSMWGKWDCVWPDGSYWKVGWVRRKPFAFKLIVKYKSAVTTQFLNFLIFFKKHLQLKFICFTFVSQNKKTFFELIKIFLGSLVSISLFGVKSPSGKINLGNKK